MLSQSFLRHFERPRISDSVDRAGAHLVLSQLSKKLVKGIDPATQFDYLLLRLIDLNAVPHFSNTALT
jgi:hypothetical protein